MLTIYGSYVDHTMIVYRWYVFKIRIINNNKFLKLKYQHPKPPHIVWMMSGNAQTGFEQPLNMLLGKIDSGIVAM
jgi:hypothetical protein